MARRPSSNFWAQATTLSVLSARRDAGARSVLEVLGASDERWRVERPWTSAQNRSRCFRHVEAPKLDLDDFPPGGVSWSSRLGLNAKVRVSRGGGRVQVRVRENGEVRGWWSSSSNSSSRRSKMDFVWGGSSLSSSSGEVRNFFWGFHPQQPKPALKQVVAQKNRNENRVFRRQTKTGFSTMGFY